MFEFGGLRDRQRDHIDWVLKASLEQGAEPDDAITDEAVPVEPSGQLWPWPRGQCETNRREAGTCERDICPCPGI